MIRNENGEALFTNPSTNMGLGELPPVESSFSTREMAAAIAGVVALGLTSGVSLAQPEKATAATDPKFLKCFNYASYGYRNIIPPVSRPSFPRVDGVEAGIYSRLRDPFGMDGNNIMIAGDEFGSNKGRVLDWTCDNTDQRGYPEGSHLLFDIEQYGTDLAPRTVKLSFGNPNLSFVRANMLDDYYRNLECVDGAESAGQKICTLPVMTQGQVGSLVVWVSSRDAITDYSTITAQLGEPDLNPSNDSTVSKITIHGVANPFDHSFRNTGSNPKVTISTPGKNFSTGVVDKRKCATPPRITLKPNANGQAYSVQVRPSKGQTILPNGNGASSKASARAKAARLIASLPGGAVITSKIPNSSKKIGSKIYFDTKDKISNRHPWNLKIPIKKTNKRWSVIFYAPKGTVSECGSQSLYTKSKK